MFCPPPSFTLLPYTTLFRSVSYYTPMAESRGLTLRTKQDCPRIYVSTDLEFIDRILSNLVDNAVKFTEEGFIEIDVTEEADHVRSEEHTSELQSRENLVCRL